MFQGAALLGGVNALHTAFPGDAEEEYKCQGIPVYTLHHFGRLLLFRTLPTSWSYCEKRAQSHEPTHVYSFLKTQMKQKHVLNTIKYTKFLWIAVITIFNLEKICCFFVVILSMSVSIHNFLLLISFLETIPLLKDLPVTHCSYCCMIVMTKSKPSLQSLSLKFSKSWYACCSRLSKLSCTKPHHPLPPFLQVDFLSGTFGFMVLNRICEVVE